MKDKVLFEWTFPNEDWLVGMEYVPEIVITFEEGSYDGSIFSVGFFFFRIDFLINK